jgi:lysophospholipase L1-like esterase
METKAETKAPPPKQGLLRRLLKPVLFTLAFFLIIEIGLRIVYAIRNAQVTAVPLPYVIGHSYGPTPPWLQESMFMPDPDLIWKNRPNLRRRYVDIFSPIDTDAERRSLLRRFRPSLPEVWTDNPSWEVTLNSDGFRTDEIAREKPASTCRIVCLGDSWTFGMNVDQDQSYPRRLNVLLSEAFPQIKFEVLNLGVLGYTSHQGLELLRKKALDLNPDLVVIGFGMNDAKIIGRSDKDAAAYEKNTTFADRLGRILKQSETFNLPAYFAQLVKFDPKPIGHYLKEEGDDDEGDNNEPASPPDPTPAGQGEPATDPYAWLNGARVPPADYERNVRELVRLARERDFGVVLLYNELWYDGPYQKALEKVAASQKVALVNSSAILAEARQRMEHELEQKLRLQPSDAGTAAPDNEVELVFRVFLGDRPVPRAMYIAGNHPKLGDRVPNKIALYDDGTHGDQKAGDGVWSFAATFPAEKELRYVYTNSGREGQWEGLDVPHIRETKAEPEDRGKRVYLPIESFGKIYMQADGWHPNAEGYELIARALFEVLKQDEKVTGPRQR